MPGIRELRADLAAQVRRAHGGQRLVVTDGGRPVAILGPLGDGPADAGGRATIDDLYAVGAVLRPRRDDGRIAAGAIDVYANVRFDRLIAEIRG